MNKKFGKYSTLILHTLVGAIIGVLVLHPVTKIVYWFEFKQNVGPNVENLWQFLLNRLESAFLIDMLPMSFIFSFIGGSIGLAFAIYHLALINQQHMVRFLEQELAEDLPSLIRGGESEHLEFKTSVRWDFRQEKSNRTLEIIIAKTIAGFLNHRGGNLLIGVNDAGDIIGLECDYSTFRHKNRDGFELCVTEIITNRLGANLCALIHFVFYKIESKDICRIVIEPSVLPVYLQDGDVAKYFLRTGNGTRELDAREALAHITGQN